MSAGLLAVETATLTIAGQPLTARPDPPAETARWVVGAMTLDGRGRRQHHAANLVVLLSALVADEDHAALSAVMAERVNPPTLRVLGDAASWLVEQATGRGWGEAWALAGWALAEWRRWRGRLLARGAAEPATLSDLLDVAEAMAGEDVAAAQAAALLGAKPPATAVTQAVKKAWRERDSWGADGGAGMMALLGAGGKGGR